MHTYIHKFHGSIGVSQKQWEVKQITNNKYTQLFSVNTITVYKTVLYIMFTHNKLFSVIKTKGVSLRLFSRNKKCSAELQAIPLYQMSPKSDKTCGQYGFNFLTH
jgi:hypothetical protein